MPRIDLQGQLLISSELCSRLRDRGLITAGLQCTDNFIAYIQECIARDDARMPYSAPLQCCVTESPVKTISTQGNAEGAINQQVIQRESLAAPSKQVDADLVKDRLSVLYNRG